VAAEKTVGVVVHLDPETHRKLKEAAKADDRSLASFVRRALAAVVAGEKA
jgi:predicted HicB family RNase H-like nuclease